MKILIIISILLWLALVGLTIAYSRYDKAAIVAASGAAIVFAITALR